MRIQHRIQKPHHLEALLLHAFAEQTLLAQLAEKGLLFGEQSGEQGGDGGGGLGEEGVFGAEVTQAVR